MQAEIISVGTELLLGDVVDTNASYIAKTLASLGIDLFRKTTVGDNRERIGAAFKEALARADLVIITGGLGPTEDDLTKETVSEVMGEELRLNEEVLERIKRRLSYPKRGTEEGMVKQAMVPSSAKIIPNPVGTAPGIILEKGGKTAILLPGVPREMERMMQEGVVPYLREKKQSTESIRSKVLKVVGMGESQVEKAILDLLREQSNPTIGLLAKRGEVHVRITAKFEEKRVMEEKIKQVEKKIRSRLGDYIYGADDETLEGKVAFLLKEKNLTVSVAESCSGGVLSHRLTNVPGSSNYFQAGVVSYSNQAKSQLLGVSSSLIEEKGAVSSEVAKEMARGIRKLMNTDLGVGITGIAGPTGATPKKPVGLVYIAISASKEELCEKFIFPGEREDVKWRASQAALDSLRRYLLEKKGE
ncbi:competence/damage-inducible protein A [Candidatus Aerophobetes bacterium]|nr:competence/damage-inducible protein A [Candidatus Aerophobetes bacterium]